MDAANLIAGEKVQIVDNNNGERLETYIIKGERGSGCICLNGAAARKVQVGDTVIIIAYALMDFEEAKTFKPTVVFPKRETGFNIQWKQKKGCVMDLWHTLSFVMVRTNHIALVHHVVAILGADRDK